jgi:hypothetical protein
LIGGLARNAAFRGLQSQAGESRNVNLPDVAFRFWDKFPEADADKCNRHVISVAFELLFADNHEASQALFFV